MENLLIEVATAWVKYDPMHGSDGVNLASFQTAHVSDSVSLGLN